MIYVFIVLLLIILLISYLITKKINEQPTIILIREILDLYECEDDVEIKNSIYSFLEDNKKIIMKNKHLKEKYEKIVC